MHLLAIAVAGASSRKERRSLSSWPTGCRVWLLKLSMKINMALLMGKPFRTA
jgi:hypothetical protein